MPKYLFRMSQHLSSMRQAKVLEQQLLAQNSRFSHAPPPGLQSRQSKTDHNDLRLKDHNYAPLDKPSVQLHNSSFQPKLVECGRMTRKHELIEWI